MPQLEFEVKVRISEEELRKLREVLKNELRGEYLGGFREEDIYVDLSRCGINREEVALRIRRRGSEGRITLKKRIHSEVAKIREELEVEVSDPSKLVEMVRALGLDYIEVVKEREVFRVGDKIKVSLDRVEGLGTFIEVEVINPSSEEEFNELVNTLLTKLGLSGRELITKSYLEMSLERGGRG